GHEAVFHRTFDVAEQDDAVDVRRILRAVDEGLVEHERLAVAPDTLDAVNEDVALLRIGRDQAEVIAQRAREGIAVRAELAARRQHREHRAVYSRDRIEQLDGLRAKRTRRWKEGLVPLEIKALPATLEERIEAPIVVLGCGADKAFVE